MIHLTQAATQYASSRTMVSESGPDSTTRQPSDKYRLTAGLARSTLRLSVCSPRIRA